MNELKKAVVTVTQPKEHLLQIARAISTELNINLIPKNKLSITKLKEKYSIENLIVVREDRIQVINQEELFFHPGMASVRIKMLKKGQKDTMVTAMDLNPGEKVLDCTIGLANDAIVASFVTGKKGKIIGIESNPFIYTITKWGLKTYTKGSKILRNSLTNIEIIWASYKNYLPQIPDNSFDVVYFDPMFDKPLYKSSGIKPLRSFANYAQLEINSIHQALRIAKKRVVIKTRAGSHLLKSIPVDEIVGGKYSSISFGIFYKEKYNLNKNYK